ncbi:MAG: hypothetical protein K2W85_08235 [Phycisphaerales bacterium]|nr:hypothetical protein [Phycisphaerales bacterium]
MTVHPNGDVFVGGGFTTAGGVATSKIARFNPTSNTWSALGSGIQGSGVSSIAVLPDGDLIVGGFFSGASGVAASHIARYHIASNTWSALGSGTDGHIGVVVVLPNGDAVVSGFFSTAGGVLVSQNARYSPSSDTWSALGSAFPRRALGTLAVLQSGDLLVGGNFPNPSGVAASHLARYNPNSNVWTALGFGSTGTSSAVRAVAVLPSGDIVAGGNFTTFGGVAANNVVRYNTTSNTWSPLGAGTSGTVHALAVLPGGDLLVAGEFTMAGGAAAGRIARYSPNSNVWSALGTGTDQRVYDLATLPDGDVLASGPFTIAGGNVCPDLARYTFTTPAPLIRTHPTANFACPRSSALFSVDAEGLGTLTYQWQIQTSAGTWINLTNDPAPIPCPLGGIGAAFASLLPAPNTHAASIGVRECPVAMPGWAVPWPVRCIVSSNCGSVTSNAATLTICPADFDCTGALTAADIFEFLNAWFTNNPAANINGNTLDASDIFDFLNAWFTGC